MSSDNLVYISDVNVTQALALAKQELQRLLPAPVSKTRYLLVVEVDSHYAAAEILVTIKALRHSSNASFHPKLRYTVCCDIAKENKATFKHHIQIVYNTLIRPIHWDLGPDSEEVELESTWPSCKEIAEADLWSLQSLPWTADKPQTALDYSKVAKDMVSALSRGRLDFTVGSFPTCNTPVDTVDEQLRFADELWKLVIDLDKYKVITWANRFYSSCMRFLLKKWHQHREGNRAKERAAGVASAINGIVNDLCVESNGQVCLCCCVAYTGFGRLEHNFSALKSEPNCREFRHCMVTELRGKFRMPSADELVFHAPAVIAFLWGLDYAKICQDLGVPKLASFDLSFQVFRVGGQELHTYAVRFDKVCPRHGSYPIISDGVGLEAPIDGQYFDLAALDGCDEFLHFFNSYNGLLQI